MTYAIWTLLGFAALAGVARLFMGYAPSHLEGALLSRREQAIVATFADAFFPPNGPIAVSGQEAGVPRYFDDYLKRSAPTQRLLIRLLILYIELEPLLFGPRPSRFSRLTQAERVLALESTSTSSIYFRRVSFISLRALMTMAYLASDDVARAMRMKQSADPFGLGDRVLEVTPTNRSELHP
jgi:hypothetical protein